MRFLFLGLNYAPEEIGIAVYSSGLCQDLAAMGHEVRAIAGQPYYPQWRLFDGYGRRWERRTEENVDLTRCPHYIPATPSGARRLVHHASFALSAVGPLISAARRFRPDLVMTVAPSLIAAPAALLAARACKAPSWLHIQDFEVEAAFATGLMKSGGWSSRLARGIERKIIQRFDRVSSISPQMCRKLLDFDIPSDRVTEFRNWAEIEAIRPLERPSVYREQWGITSPFVAFYSGNIANKQGIEIIVEAARLLEHRSDLTFVICGEGPNRANLEIIAKSSPNIRLFDLQPRERLGELLGMADIHLLPQIVGAADLVLPSKMANMLASGRPVVATAPPDTGLANEVDGVGLVTPPGDAHAFALAIERLLDNPAERARLGVLARQRAEERWSRKALIAKFTEQAEHMCKSSGPNRDQARRRLSHLQYK